MLALVINTIFIADCGLRIADSQSPLYFGAELHELVEVFVGGGFAVAGEGDVVETAEMGRHSGEFLGFVDAAGGD